MEMVIKLLEEAVQLYRTHNNEAGDKALTVAVRIRKEIQRGEKQISQET